MKVIPTILTTNVNEWKEQMILFPNYYKRIQLDVCDGIQVPNTTTQIDEMIKALSTNELRIAQDITFDFHLMVKDYQRAIESIKELNSYLRVNTILLNAALLPPITNLRKQYPSYDIGLDIDINTNIDWVLKEFDLTLLKSIQIMTVKQGLQGNPFNQDSLNKITHLRNAGYKDMIMIDGGINENTLKIILSHPNVPDFLCIGSYLTKAGSRLMERVEYLKSLES